MELVAGRFGIETAFNVTALLAVFATFARTRDEVHAAMRDDYTKPVEYEVM